MARTIREILQTETIYTDEKIVEDGAKYYIDENGNKTVSSTSSIGNKKNGIIMMKQLFRRSVPLYRRRRNKRRI